MGVILIPTIGNLSEHLVAVQLSLKDRVDFSMAVSIGSSLQVALFVAPVLVLIGLVVNQPMDLVFTPLEVAAVAVAAGIAALVSLDGESNWLEGALLLGVYAILGVSFFYLARAWGRRRRGLEGARTGRLALGDHASEGCWAGFGWVWCPPGTATAHSAGPPTLARHVDLCRRGRSPLAAAPSAAQHPRHAWMTRPAIDTWTPPSTMATDERHHLEHASR